MANSMSPMYFLMKVIICLINLNFLFHALWLFIFTVMLRLHAEAIMTGLFKMILNLFKGTGIAIGKKNDSDSDSKNDAAFYTTNSEPYFIGGKLKDLGNEVETFMAAFFDIVIKEVLAHILDCVIAYWFFLLTVALLGLVSLCINNKFVYYVYLACVSLMAFIKLVVILDMLCKRDHYDTKGTLYFRGFIQERYTGNLTDPPTVLVDMIQGLAGCCGSVNATDYKKAKKWDGNIFGDLISKIPGISDIPDIDLNKLFTIDYPLTCCKLNNQTKKEEKSAAVILPSVCPLLFTEKNSYMKIGCAAKLKTYANTAYDWGIAVLVILLLEHLLVIYLLLLLVFVGMEAVPPRNRVKNTETATLVVKSITENKEEEKPEAMPLVTV